MQNFIDQQHSIGFKLIDWYTKHQRSLPWRETKDPYKIWLSEIILQQTRVVQGQSYYEKFISHYPTVHDLANAEEDQIMKDWQGLGYYSRARNLHASAKMIVNEMNGKMPDSYNSIKQLKGVGDYTAAAIASFAYDLPHPVLDGNVYRFLSRFFGIETPIDTNQAKKEFLEVAEAIMPNEEAAQFNQAIMEFGALQCVPKSPKCENCPFIDKCYAYSNEAVDKLPIKKGKIKQRERFFNYLIIHDGENLLISKRKKGIWQNLYEFILIESENAISKSKLEKSESFQDILNNSSFKLESSSEKRKHILSHQTIWANFYHLKVSQLKTINRTNCIIVPFNRLNEYAIPRLLENYLREETNLLSLPK